MPVYLFVKIPLVNHELEEVISFAPRFQKNPFTVGQTLFDRQLQNYSVCHSFKSINNFIFKNQGLISFYRIPNERLECWEF